MNSLTPTRQARANVSLPHLFLITWRPLFILTIYYYGNMIEVGCCSAFTRSSTSADSPSLVKLIAILLFLFLYLRFIMPFVFYALSFFFRFSFNLLHLMDISLLPDIQIYTLLIAEIQTGYRTHGSSYLSH